MITKEQWLKLNRKELESMDGKEGLEWWDTYSQTIFDLHDKIFNKLGE